MSKDIYIANEEYLQAQQEDFYGFLKENRWSDAQAIVDNLYDIGKTAEAVTLRKALLNAQVGFAEGQEAALKHFAPKDNPLNTVKVQMDTILSELNPNRGDAPY